MLRALETVSNEPLGALDAHQSIKVFTKSMIATGAPASSLMAVHLGSFGFETDAAIAYNYHAVYLFGEFARLNDLSDIVYMHDWVPAMRGAGEGCSFGAARASRIATR
jgi:hypothetical protein